MAIKIFNSRLSEASKIEILSFAERKGIIKEKDVNEMVVKRNLKKESEEKKRKENGTEAVKLEISKAGQILIIFSFMNQDNVPFGLQEEQDDSDEYNIRRTREVMGTGIAVEEPRKGILDTGFHMGDFQRCEGAITIFNQLRERGWVIDAAHWKKQQSQGSKQKQSNHLKCKVVISMSPKGEKLKLEERTFKGIIRLMYRTWAVHAWDNRHLLQRNVVLNFPFLHSEGTPAEQKFVLEN